MTSQFDPLRFQREMGNVLRWHKDFARLAEGMQPLSPDTWRAVDGARLQSLSLQDTLSSLGPALTAAVDVQASLRKLQGGLASQQASFAASFAAADLLSATKIPRADLNNLLSSLRTAAGISASGAFAEASAVVDTAAADHAADEEAEVSWLYRLSLLELVAFLAAALGVLDQLGRFYADAANVDVPPELRSGTDVLFRMVALLLFILSARTKPVE